MASNLASPPRFELASGQKIKTKASDSVQYGNLVTLRSCFKSEEDFRVYIRAHRNSRFMDGSQLHLVWSNKAGGFSGDSSRSRRQLQSYEAEAVELKPGDIVSVDGMHFAVKPATSPEDLLHFDPIQQ